MRYSQHINVRKSKQELGIICTRAFRGPSRDVAKSKTAAERMRISLPSKSPPSFPCVPPCESCHVRDGVDLRRMASKWIEMGRSGIIMRYVVKSVAGRKIRFNGGGYMCAFVDVVLWKRSI
jgi:hypothetical protein